MSKNKKQRQKQARAQPKGKGLVGLCNVENYDSLTCSGYTTLAQSPDSRSRRFNDNTSDGKY